MILVIHTRFYLCPGNKSRTKYISHFSVHVENQDDKKFTHFRPCRPVRPQRPCRPVYFLFWSWIYEKKDYRPLDRPAFLDIVHLFPLKVQIFCDFRPIVQRPGITKTRHFCQIFFNFLDRRLGGGMLIDIELVKTHRKSGN